MEAAATISANIPWSAFDDSLHDLQLLQSVCVCCLAFVPTQVWNERKLGRVESMAQLT